MACEGDVNISQREVAETLKNILKDAPQVCLVSEIPLSLGIIFLTQVGCLQSTEVQKEAQCLNIENPPGTRQVQISVRSQRGHQKYQSQRIIVKV